MGGRGSQVKQVQGDWLTQSATQTVFRIYEAAGFQLFAVGGCVRNALLGVPVSDIDMSSNARPDVATRFLEGAGLKVIPTGIDHGTITVISDCVPFEITTFRRDVETDGRRAVVAFSEDIIDDAQRRDFTINALYADKHGHILDPVGGLSDIAAPHIRFIGDAFERIREDYLRSLRYFRFFAHYAHHVDGFDPEALAAIVENLEGLSSLSRERVGTELIKLLSAPDPVKAIMGMKQSGVWDMIAPGESPELLGPLVHLESELGLAPNPIRRLAVMIGADAGESLRFSRSQIRDIKELRRMVFDPAGAAELGFRFGKDGGLDALAVRFASLIQPIPKDAPSDVLLGAQAEFPIKASDLMPDVQGPELGEKLRALEAKWIASRFSMTREQLLG